MYLHGRRNREKGKEGIAHGYSLNSEKGAACIPAYELREDFILS